VTESSPLHPGDPDATGAPEGTPGPIAYGMLKAGCEAAIAREYPVDRWAVVRPGVVLGPGEYVGRVPWWLSRMRRGGQVLAPGSPQRGIQPVDVRDLAGFVLHLAESATCGAFNVAPPQGRETYADLLTACIDAVGSDGPGPRPDLVWVDEQWLAAHGVRQWTELPLWRIPAGTWAMDVVAATAAGLTCRRLAETVQDVWAWLQSGGTPVSHPRWADHGIDPAKEAALLAAWNVERTPTP